MLYRQYKKGLDWLQKVGNPEKIVKSVKEPKTQILRHEIELNPSKDRAVHEGDNPSFLDEFMKYTFFLPSRHNTLKQR
jgi:hypothetical protein